MLEYPPPPCPVDDEPFTSCCTTHYSIDANGRIHPGRGGVIVIVQLPARDAAGAASPAAAAPASSPPAPAQATTTRRARRPRP
jgi:hypothetical protein